MDKPVGASEQIWDGLIDENATKQVFVAENLAFPQFSIKKSTAFKEAVALVDALNLDLSFLEDRVKTVGESDAFQIIYSLIHKLNIVADSLLSAERVQFIEYFRASILPLTFESEFCEYSYTKPRGYAGDYGAMEMIWKGRTNSQEFRYRGKTGRGKLINALTLDMHNCKANEYRVHKLKDIILGSGDNVSVASIGSGSGIEIGEAAQNQSLRRCCFHLFDQDEGALEAARARLQSFSIAPVLHKGNILKTVFSIPEHAYDCVYSSGLFDYFKDSSSLKLAQKLWASVRPGGVLCITNAHPDNPSRFWMEYVMDWYLEYKNFQTLLLLLGSNQNFSRIVVDRDPFGSYLYLQLYKNRS